METACFAGKNGEFICKKVTFIDKSMRFMDFFEGRNLPKNKFLIAIMVCLRGIFLSRLFHHEGTKITKVHEGIFDAFLIKRQNQKIFHHRLTQIFTD